MMHHTTFNNSLLSLVYFDPLLDSTVTIRGTSFMSMSMDEYAKLRVPEGLKYGIVNELECPLIPVPSLSSLPADDPLNMFYKYLNAI